MSRLRRDIIFGEVVDERRRQLNKWGPQSHDHASKFPMHEWAEQMHIAKETCDNAGIEDISWEDILWEEITEAFCEDESWKRRRYELIQVMAVALAEIEDGDKKARKAKKEQGLGLLTQVSDFEPTVD
jgi:hypothetical protein